MAGCSEQGRPSVCVAESRREHLSFHDRQSTAVVLSTRAEEENKDKSRSKGRRLLLPSRKPSPKAASNTNSSNTSIRGSGGQGNAAPPSSLVVTRAAVGDAAGSVGTGGASVPLDRQGSEESRALLLLGRRGAGQTSSSSPTNAAPAGTAAATGAEAGGQENNGEECQDLEDNGVFFKYVRLGAVRLNVSTTGYKLVRLSEFPVLVAPYARRGKMTNWKRFMHKCIWRMVRHTTRSGLSQLKPVGVFGRIPEDEEKSSRQLVPRPGQLPKSLLRRSPRGGDGEVGGGGTAATRRGHVAHGPAGRCSTLGGDSGSSSEEGGDAEGEEEEEEEEGVGESQAPRAEEGVARCSSMVASVDACGGAGSDGGGGGGGDGGAAQAAGSHAKAPSVDSGWSKRGSGRSSGIAGKAAGAKKKSGVGAMFRRRLRSVRGSQASVVSEAAAAVSVEEGRAAGLEMPPDGEPIAAEGAGNDGFVGDPARAAPQGSSRVVGPKGVAEAGAIFLRDGDDRGHSSPSSSSSSSAASPSSRRQGQAPSEVVMRTPVGIRLGRRRRRRSREGNTEAGGRDDGGADAGALVDGGIAGVGVGVGRGKGRADGDG